MTRGDIVAAATGSGLGGKLRPVVIIQSDDFDACASVVVCLLTTREVASPLFRLEIPPHGDNGLRERSWLMIDKLVTVPRDKLGQRIGRLGAEDLVRMNRALMVFLGLAG